MLFILVTSLLHYCVRTVGYMLSVARAAARDRRPPAGRQNYSDGFVTFRGLSNDLRAEPRQDDARARARLICVISSCRASDSNYRYASCIFDTSTVVLLNSGLNGRRDARQEGFKRGAGKNIRAENKPSKARLSLNVDLD